MGDTPDVGGDERTPTRRSRREQDADALSTREAGSSDAAEDAAPDERTVVVDRTGVVDRTVVVDRTAPEDRTVVIDRTAPEDRTVAEDRTVVVDRTASDDRTVVVDRTPRSSSAQHPGSELDAAVADTIVAPPQRRGEASMPAIYKPRPAPIVPSRPPAVSAGPAPTRDHDAVLASVARRSRRSGMLAVLAVALACVVSAAGLLTVGLTLLG